jgi:hypothetical protein
VLYQFDYCLSLKQHTVSRQLVDVVAFISVLSLSDHFVQSFGVLGVNVLYPFFFFFFANALHKISPNVCTLLWSNERISASLANASAKMFHL